MTSSQSPLLLAARIERWPIAGAFTISRGAKTEAVTVVAEVSRGGLIGRGECVPYPRYGETPEATLAALKSMREPLRRGLAREALGATALLGLGQTFHDRYTGALRRPDTKVRALGTGELRANRKSPLKSSVPSACLHACHHSSSRIFLALSVPTRSAA